MAVELTVDFSEPLPIFALGSVAMLPHAAVPLHIFEPRYRQMVRDCLAAAGDRGLLHARAIALSSCHGSPLRLRDVACVGKLVQVQPLADGRFNVVLHGVTRARMTEVEPPDDERLYHRAMFEPMRPEDSGVARGVRRELHGVLADPTLRRFHMVDQVLGIVANAEIPAQAAIDVAGDALVHGDEDRYALLAAEDSRSQGTIIWEHVQRMRGLARAADRQSHGRWPRGASWN